MSLKKNYKNLKTLRDKRIGQKKSTRNLLFCENMKNDEAGGIGIILLTTLTSEIRRGRADTAPSSSSFTNSSISQFSGRIRREFFVWGKY